MMEYNDEITACKKAAVNYPDLAKKLSGIGVESYTVDTATGTMLYRFGGGKNILHESTAAARIVHENFDEAGTIQAIRNNQQGKTDYLGFMNEIASAGVRFYEATLCGENKRVTYIGTGGYYEELIPWPVN